MSSPRGEKWRFQVHQPQADRVYLVRYDQHGTSDWLPMRPRGDGGWELELTLGAGTHHFGHFTCEGTAYFNGGTFGLSGVRLSEPDARVNVAPLPGSRDDEPAMDEWMPNVTERLPQTRGAKPDGPSTEVA